MVRLNNGEPSLHATSMAAADPAASETVVHIGAGTGYYTAILASVRGEAGNGTTPANSQGTAGGSALP